jgi:hypothetical protein
MILSRDAHNLVEHWYPSVCLPPSSLSPSDVCSCRRSKVKATSYTDFFIKSLKKLGLVPSWHTLAMWSPASYWSKAINGVNIRICDMIIVPPFRRRSLDFFCRWYRVNRLQVYNRTRGARESGRVQTQKTSETITWRWWVACCCCTPYSALEVESTSLQQT